MKFSIGFLAIALAISGCSLINALDDVAPASDASTGDGGTTTSNSAIGGGGSGASASTSSGGSGGSGGSGAGGNGGGTPTSEGLIVVGGLINLTTQGVLVTLDGDTGVELVREELSTAPAEHILATAYDGLKDEWYIFKGSGFPVDPTTVATLEVRTFDRVSTSWTIKENISLGTVAPVDAANVIVLKNRLVYSAYNGINNLDLVTISTENTPQIIDQSDITASMTSIVLGLNGYPSNSSSGGVVNVVMRNDTTCEVELRLVNVNQNTTNVTSTLANIGNALACGGQQPGVPAWSIDHQEPNTGVLAMPPATNGIMGSIIRYNMSTQTAIDTREVTMNGGRILDMVMTPCDNTALFVEHLIDQTIFAVPLDAAGTQTSVQLGHQGQQIHFEPFHNKALDFFDGGDNVLLLQAFVVGGTDLMPTLTTAQPPAWTPPNDIRPRMVATRMPLPFQCP